MNFNQKKRKGLVAKFENKLRITKINAIVRIFFLFFNLASIIGVIFVAFYFFPHDHDIVKVQKVELPLGNYVVLKNFPVKNLEIDKKDFEMFNPKDTVFVSFGFSSLYLCLKSKEVQNLFFCYKKKILGIPFYTLRNILNVSKNSVLVLNERSAGTSWSFAGGSLAIIGCLLMFIKENINKKGKKVWKNF